MKIDISGRIPALRNIMENKGYDFWLVFLADEHGSEYVDDHYKEIEYLCGFSGTNATLLVTRTEALLWTDGRYFIQAESEIAGTDTILMRQGVPGVDSVQDHLKKALKPGSKLGFDGTRLSHSEALEYEELAAQAGAGVISQENIMDLLWRDRVPCREERIWILDETHSGESSEKKLSRVRAEMKDKKAQAHLLTNLCDIAWLFNLRGDDIEHTPVFFSYAIVTEKDAALYVRKRAMSREVKRYLNGLGVKVRPYDKIYDDISRIRVSSILCDPKSVNETLLSRISKKAEIIEGDDPVPMMRAVKNRGEIRNTRRAHLADGIAVTRFIYRLKHMDGRSFTELSAAEFLHELRAENHSFLDESFETISAFGEHAALPHYTADSASDIPLEGRGLYLVDSGGHYLTGTTDITRTVSLGEISSRERQGYTFVLKGALRLMAMKFPKGTTGRQLDIMARAPLWSEGLDYRHGTGHGVGHILSVHEGPNSISQRNGACAIKPGMITTDEPGLYEEGSFGVRIENELLCVKDVSNKYGSFYRFENITLAPIDLDPLDRFLLTEEEKKILNAYHARVRVKLSPYLEKQEADWLFEVTKAL